MTLDPKNTALLVLDMTKVICSTERYSRCPPIIPAVRKFVSQARAKGVMILFTSTKIPDVSKTQIWPELAPSDNDPFFQGLLDKFIALTWRRR